VSVKTAKLDIKELLTSAGYTTNAFTSAECAAIFDKVTSLVTEGRSTSEAVPIAISICAPAKARSQAAGSFEADAVKGIKIRGGAYRWQDTKDGYFTVFDVPLFSELSEGTKGAPEPVNKGYLEGMVRTAQERYQLGNYCGRAFIGHHKDIELAPPTMAGYVLPNRVGLAKIENAAGEMVDSWTAFGNLKVNTATFEKIKHGDLPGTSVEVPWSKKRIAGLALLGSRPPHFEYPNLTLGDQVTEPASASFQAQDDPILKEDAMTFEEMMAKLNESFDVKLAKFQTEITAKFAAKADDKKADDKVSTEKVDPLPVEPTTKAKPEEDAKLSLDQAQIVAMFAERDAKIAGLEADNKAAKAAEEKRVAEQAKADRILKAEAELRGLIVSPDIKSQLAVFAHDEKMLGIYVATLKKTSQKAPPMSEADFAGTPVDASDPTVSKFSAMGPDAVEKAAKFAAQYREMKRLGWKVTSTEEDYVKFHLESTKLTA